MESPTYARSPASSNASFGSAPAAPAFSILSPDAPPYTPLSMPATPIGQTPPMATPTSALATPTSAMATPNSAMAPPMATPMATDAPITPIASAGTPVLTNTPVDGSPKLGRCSPVGTKQSPLHDSLLGQWSASARHHHDQPEADQLMDTWEVKGNPTRASRAPIRLGDEPEHRRPDAYFPEESNSLRDCQIKKQVEAMFEQTQAEDGVPEVKHVSTVSPERSLTTAGSPPPQDDEAPLTHCTEQQQQQHQPEADYSPADAALDHAPLDHAPLDHAPASPVAMAPPRATSSPRSPSPAHRQDGPAHPAPRSAPSATGSATTEADVSPPSRISPVISKMRSLNAASRQRVFPQTEEPQLERYHGPQAKPSVHGPSAVERRLAARAAARTARPPMTLSSTSSAASAPTPSPRLLAPRPSSAFGAPRDSAARDPFSQRFFRPVRTVMRSAQAERVRQIERQSQERVFPSAWAGRRRAELLAARAPTPTPAPTSPPMATSTAHSSPVKKTTSKPERPPADLSQPVYGAGRRLWTPARLADLTTAQREDYVTPARHGGDVRMSKSSEARSSRSGDVTRGVIKGEVAARNMLSVPRGHTPMSQLGF